MNTDNAIKAYLETLEQTLKEGQEVAHQIARGLGGRELALSLTKLQEALMWIQQAKKERKSTAAQEERFSV